MKARIKWIENVSFVGESESGHALVMDGAPEGGGRNLGPRPMETVLIGTGGCTAYDVVHILRKSRAPVTDCVVEIDAERARRRPEGLHANPLSFHRDGQGAEAAAGRARGSPVGGEILLGFDHARQDGGDHARFRDREVAVSGAHPPCTLEDASLPTPCRLALRSLRSSTRCAS